MTKELVIKALKMAIINHRPGPGLLMHSERAANMPALLTKIF